MAKYWKFIFFVFFSSATYSQPLIEKVPLRLIDNLFFLEVTINGSVTPLNFVFDSGAGLTVIDTKLAERLDLNITGSSKIGTSGKSINSDESAGNSIKLGEKLLLDSVSLSIMDLSHLSKYLKFNVDGIIGYDLLRNVITETNVDALEMRFYSKIDYRHSGTSMGLALIALESNHFGIPIEVTPKNRTNSLTLIFKIDTGAANYLTVHNVPVKTYDLIDPKRKYKTRKGFGADSTITNNIKGKLKKVSFGNKTWKNVPVIFEVDPLNNSSTREAAGLIGQELLLDFNITYDLINRMIFLEKR